MNETRPDPSDDRILELERVFYASRDRVFAAWTEPDLIASWWGRAASTRPSTESRWSCAQGDASRRSWCSTTSRSPRG